MSTLKDRIKAANEKVAQIGVPDSANNVPPSPPVATDEPAASPVRPAAPRASKTGPGSLLAVMGLQEEDARELEGLRAQLQRWVDAQPSMALDPAKIEEGPFHNRDEETFHGQEWEDFKASIRITKGNVQPVLVRIKAGTTDTYEMVFGRRRTRACLEEGFPVTAVVRDTFSDLQLWEAMEFENIGQKRPSPYEQGRSYKMALDAGLFLGPAALADHLRKDRGLVTRYLTIARLPDAVLNAFPSRSSVQKHWAEALAAAVQRDPDGVLERAAAAAGRKGTMTAKDVLAFLITLPGKAAGKRVVVASDSGATLATIDVKNDRTLSVRTAKGFAISDRLLEAVKVAVERERDKGKR